MVNPLSHRAVLVTLNQRAWKGKAADRELAAQTELQANAEQGTMSVIKELTPKYLIQPIRTILTVGRNEHYKMCSPGLIRGQHLLPAKMLETYLMAQGEIQNQFELAVADYIKIYPEIRAKAKNRFGSAYRDRDFPTAEGIKSYFSYSFYASPVPDVSDWRIDGVDPKEIADMKAQVEDSVSAMFNEAVATLYERVRVALEGLINQATKYRDKGPNGNTLSDATIDLIKELSEMVCDMNITNDPVLDKLGREMLKEFADMSAKDLRRNADQRKTAAATAQRLLNRIVSQRRAA